MRIRHAGASTTRPCVRKRAAVHEEANDSYAAVPGKLGKLKLKYQQGCCPQHDGNAPTQEAAIHHNSDCCWDCCCSTLCKLESK